MEAILAVSYENLLFAFANNNGVAAAHLCRLISTSDFLIYTFIHVHFKLVAAQGGLCLICLETQMIDFS